MTGYSFKDANNLWRIKPAYPQPNQVLRNERAFGKCDLYKKKWLGAINFSRTYNHGKLLPVKNMDQILLEHVLTKTHLLTHDVASPLTTTNTEFTTISPSKKERFADTVFRIEIQGVSQKREVKIQSDMIRIVHVPLGVLMSIKEGSFLDKEWGYGQFEVNGNKKKTDDKKNLWYIYENVYQEDLAEKNKTMSVSFLSKFVEQQRLMLEHNARLTDEHPFQSNPITWPFVLRGVSYWSDKKALKQVYLLPNIFGWYLTNLALMGYVALMIMELLCHQRDIQLIDPHVLNRMIKSGGFIFIGYLLHYFPFFIMGRQLFLHHYFPAQIFGYLMVGVMFDFCLTQNINWPVSSGEGKQITSTSVSWITVLIWFLGLCVHIYVFWKLTAPTYGVHSMTIEQWKDLAWLPGWDHFFQQ